MCCQNSVRGRPENSLHQERTHAECFSQSKVSVLVLRLRKTLVLTAHTEWLPGVQLRHFSPTYAVHIEDCGAGGCPVVVAQWQSTGFTSQVSWVRFPAAAGLLTFLYFHLITSKYLFIPA